MKKLMILAIAVFTLQLSAQEETKLDEKGQRFHKMQNRTPEEAANFKAKQMTLHLDLSEKQQEQVYELFLKNEEQRREMIEARKANSEEGKPSKEERMENANARLDKQIAMKKKMKEILNEEQYTKWEKKMEERKTRVRERKGERKMLRKE